MSCNLPYAEQGANLVVEDAISLSLCLEKYHFQTEPAFQEYYKQRFNGTKRAADMARYMSLFFHSENAIIHSIRQRLLSWLMNSNMMLKMAEKELFENCPVPMEHKKIVE